MHIVSLRTARSTRWLRATQAAPTILGASTSKAREHNARAKLVSKTLCLKALLLAAIVGVPTTTLLLSANSAPLASTVQAAGSQPRPRVAALITEPHMSRLPTLFAAHGGGPLPVLGDPSHAGLTAWLQRWPASVPRPKALLVVSAHWEESVTTVTSSAAPPLLYDYYGFPSAAYKLEYPATGSPELAARVAALLAAAGIRCKQDAARGLDHGAFIPLMLAYPSADIPTVQLSLQSSLDPEAHIRMGEALSALRDEGVLLFASGMSFHNMGVFMGARGGGGEGGAADSRSKEFDRWLQRTLTGGEASWAERRAALCAWGSAPQARYAHPREEHLLPLMVAFGAAKGDAARTVFSEPLLGASVSAIQFG